MIGKLFTHCGAEPITREGLKEITPPPATKTWRPIGHAELIDTLEAELHHRRLVIREEAYAVQREGALLFGVIDLAWMETDEFAAAIGLRTANDKSMSIQMAVGLRIFICDNLAFSGDLIALRRKHTARLDLPGEINRAMDRYQEGVMQLKEDVNRLKSALITDQEAKALIVDAFQQSIIPTRLFHEVVNGYFGNGYHENGNGQPEPHPRTLWALHNAFTSQVQHLPPASAFPATIQLGQLFGLTRNRSLPSVN